MYRTSWNRLGLLVLALSAAAGLTGRLTAQDARQQTDQHFLAGREAEGKRRFEAALLEYQEAARFAEQAYGGTDQAFIWANMLNREAFVHLELEQVEKAQAALTKSLQVLQSASGSVNPRHAIVESTAQRKLGELELLHHRNYTEAERLLRSSLATMERSLERQLDPKTRKEATEYLAMTQSSLGYLYFSVGQFDADHADKYLSLSKSTFESVRPVPVEKAFVLNSLGMLRIGQGRYAEAKPLLEECIAILEPLTKEHEVLGKAYGNLGWLLHQEGKLEEAEAKHGKALDVWKQREGRSLRDRATTLSNIGWAKQAEGKYGEAEKLYRESLKLRTGDLQRQALSNANLALVHQAQSQWPQAFDRMEDALKDLKRFMARTLPGMPERMQISFALDESKQDSLASFLHSALSLAYEGRDQPDAAKRAATWLLNCKAVAYQALTSRERSARDAALKGDRAARQLLQIRQDLAEQALLQNPADLGQKQLDLETLAVRFGQTNPDLERWIEPEEIQAALGKIPNSVLVEYVRFKRWDFQSARAIKSGEERYAAIVLAPQRKIELVDLGAANKIDRQLEQLTAALNTAETDVVQTRSAGVLLDPKQVAQIQKVLKGVSDQVLRPVLNQVENHQRWIISPDHRLWFVPWAALPDDKGTPYMVMKHTISCLLSGRELLASRASVEAQPPLMLAFPDYNAGVTKAGNRILPGMPSLDGTQKEAERVKPYLEVLSDRAQIKLGANALEGLVKQASSPRVLALSTHGFFLEDKYYKEKGTTGPANALLRCGVALAGCNKGADGKGQDGILTGEEVLSLDLRGTELVVLSACQTGVGDVQAGEGVASMRQAFHLAGARSVLATLWSVPDDETQSLLTSFFEELVKNGQGKAEALANAQRALILEYEKPTRFGGAHPFLWAAFTLTGDPGKL